MIAKIITWGKDRASALQAMAEALDDTRVVGPKSNLNFLRALVRHPAFRDGQVSTHFIQKHQAELLPPKAPPQCDTLALAALGLIYHHDQERRCAQRQAVDRTSPWFDATGWRVGDNERDVFRFEDETGVYQVEACYAAGMESPRVRVGDGAFMETQLSPAGYDMSFDAVIDGRRHNATVVRVGHTLHVMHHGVYQELQYHDPLHAGDEQEESAGRLTAPMPGKVVAVRVEHGSSVKKGQPLMIVEAMKMEHTIVAPADGIIASIHAAVGDQVDEKLELVRFG